MTALTDDRSTPSREGELVNYAMAAAAKIFAGGMVSLDAGYAKSMVKEANKQFAGRAEETVDNSSGAAGAQSVLVRRGRAFKWTNASGANAIAQGDVGNKAYALDDQTVTDTEAGATEVGRIIGVDSDGVWVL